VVLSGLAHEQKCRLIMVMIDFSGEKKEKAQSLAGFCKSMRKKHLKSNQDLEDRKI
jgi:hypothetical protein